MENNNDFKYILQDTSHVFFGKELSYAEMAERDDVPFKFKAIIMTYFSKDTELEYKMSEHLMNIDKESFSYKIYEQLKLQIKLFYMEEKKGFAGKIKTKWVHKSCSLDEFCNVYRDKINNGEVTIEEMSISKLALMMISI